MSKLGMAGMLQQVQKAQQEFQRLQQEAGKKTVEASAGGGMIRVVANGHQRILSIQIEDEVLKMNDKAMLQDLILAGVNEALQSAQNMLAEEMKKVTGSLGPLSSLLGG